MKKIKIKAFNILLFPVLLLALIFFISISKKNDTDIYYTKKMMKNIKKIRMAIDSYYLKTGEFPDLAGKEVKDNLNLIKFNVKDGEVISFKEIYGDSVLEKTPSFRELKASNMVYEVTDFKKVTNDGGWNYNKKTGEIHINLPYNFFEQGIDWDSF